MSNNNAPENLKTPWDYKAFTPEQRKLYDENLQRLEQAIKSAREVRDFIVDEEYWESTDGPQKAIIQQVYKQKVAKGILLPRPE